ncbi:MAG: LLM class flavin-dependent oxidoreductase [Acidobacteria bacterium]|nr:LLM class flavin-dependent oxidoreductase [Acidobacteriota bacterium]
MRYAYCINAADDFNAVVDLACEAEQAGWDGFFIPDGLAIEVPNAGPFPLFDPWVLLGAMAARTSRIRIGTMITPVPRRRPWKLARECVTVDHLSRGRLIFSAGLGAAEDDAGFHKVGEAMDLPTRAERLDEGLAVIDGLWKGTPLAFSGRHFRVDGMAMAPLPVQKPRIPVWVVAVWPKPKSLRRILAWDGVISQKYKSYGPLAPDEIRRLRDYVAEHRPGLNSFDIITGGSTSKGKGNVVKPYSDAGATWWVESDMSAGTVQKCFDRVRAGPPA